MVLTNAIKVSLEVESRVASRCEMQRKKTENLIGDSEYMHTRQRDPTEKWGVVVTSSRLSHYDRKHKY